MGKVTAGISMSLDGFIAGPNPTKDEPLGANLTASRAARPAPTTT